ncbi:hypothetical protein Lal_00045636 [Lupinus albus]|uniref:AT3G52170-like helix-turn-helix domain-containing protein n=1 Tax=Lupinus albus TaxID=3870 RepID=A0A6A5NFC3_LUPAL|nr:hypothetical protein Lalb_Chr14g0370111 [Lupinus albus]KAF1886404.1 hypothetical protein Lal_00045636 [Lupinus albus]
MLNLMMKFQSITCNHDTISKKLMFFIAPRARRLSFRFSRTKPLSIEVSNSAGPLNGQRRRWSYAASASAPSENDTLNEPKGRKRISKQERRAVVEAFVNRYREMNAGKFPSASVTQKQVGGGYYFLREIIQDLEYKSKMNPSNIRDENLVKKEPFDQSNLLTTEAVKISSVNTETAIDRPSQDVFQSVVSDVRETVNTGYDHLEEKRGSQTSSCEERELSKEIEIISTPDNHCVASDINNLEKCSEEPYPSSLSMSNDVKTEEAFSSHSDYVAPESHLLQEEKEHVSTPFSETYGTDYGQAQGHDTEFNDAGSPQIIDKKNIEKAGYERMEQAALEGLSEEPSLSSLQVPNDVKTGEDLSSHCSDSVASERHQLKEETDHDSASFIEKSRSGHSETQSPVFKFVDTENHPISEEKSFNKGHERKKQDGSEDLSGMDGHPKHKMKQSLGSSELDESKIDNSNNREIIGAVVPTKSTLWGNLKSLADGIINFWRR